MGRHRQLYFPAAQGQVDIVGHEGAVVARVRRHLLLIVVAAVSDGVRVVLA